MVKGLSVTAGDKIVFKNNGVEITNVNNDNNVNNNVDNDMFVKMSATTDLYLKVYQNEFKVWLGGYTTSQGEGGSNDNQQAQTFYLNAGVWDVDGAIMFAYIWNNDGAQGIKMVKEGDAYNAVIPAGYSNIIFVRCNPVGGDTFNWDNCWNKTTDLTIPTNGEVKYNITGWGEGTATGNWSN